MSGTSSGPVWPDWQDDRAYAYAMDLTSRGWAWEFLRRNRVFQEDLAAVSHRAGSSGFRAYGIRKLSASAAGLSSWGLLFRELDCQ